MNLIAPDATVDYESADVAITRHDARSLPLPAASVDLIVTSPPYFALRSYQDDGDHYGGQIGSEESPGEFIDALSECMEEWRRVLKPGGSVWINLGDKYAGSTGNGHGGNLNSPTYGDKQPSDRAARQVDWQGVRRKSLIGLPWRFALAQIDAGWILRAEVIWSKPNGLPESVTDRVRRSHEQWFHFTKEPRYFSAVDEIRDRKADLLGRVPGSVWDVPTEPLLIPAATAEMLDLSDHFAAFPQEWPRQIIRGWSPSGICTRCGEGRRPVVETSKDVAYGDGQHRNGTEQIANGAAITGFRHESKWETTATIVGESCRCETPDAPTRPAVVLDPFGGTGTVAGVAATLGRYGISNDLSADYNRLAVWRIRDSGHFAKTEQRTWADRQLTIGG